MITTAEREVRRVIGIERPLDHARTGGVAYEIAGLRNTAFKLLHSDGRGRIDAANRLLAAVRHEAVNLAARFAFEFSSLLTDSTEPRGVGHAQA